MTGRARRLIGQKLEQSFALKMPRAIEHVKLFLDRWYGSLAACAVLTLAMMFRFVFPLHAILVTRGIEGEDCYQMIWNLWTVCEAVTHGRNPYASSLVYYPVGANLGFHTLAAGFVPVTAFVKLFVAGDATMYPIYAYRIIVPLSFTLILFFSFRFLRLTGFSISASAISAVGYAFCDFYMEHAIHLNHIAGFFIPLAALCLVRFYQQPGRLRMMTFVAAASSSVYFTEFAIYILLAFLAFIVLLCVARSERERLFELLGGIKFSWFATSGLLGVAIATPFLLNIRALNPLKPKAFELSLYSANLAGLIVPDPRQAPLYRELFRGLWSHVTAGMGEPGVFIGFPFILFSILALVKWRKRFVVISALMAGFFFLLSLGPTLKVFESDSGLPMPYSILTKIPPFDIGRTPVRFVVVAMFFTMILTACGVSWLQSALGSRRWIVLALAFSWTVAEAYTPIARQKEFEPPPRIADVLNGPVLNLPVRRNDGFAAFLQIFHHQPIVTGFLARYTADQQTGYAEVERLFYKGGSIFCDGVRAMGIKNIIITPEEIAPNAPSYIPLELGDCDVNVVDLRLDSPQSSLERDWSRGDGQTAAYPLLSVGDRIDAFSPRSDPFLWYGWSTAEVGFRWSNSGKAAIRFSLDKIEDIRFNVAFHPFLVPGMLEKQNVRIELNGRIISTIEARDGDERIYHTIFPAEILRQNNILTLELPDAESPAHFQVSEDPRVLGINVHWFELIPIHIAKLESVNPENTAYTK